MPVNPLHMSRTANWGTPEIVVEVGRRVLGRIDVDPASSKRWNKRLVHAAHYLDGEGGRDGLKDSWRPPDHKGEYTVFLNPPGDKQGKLVKAFWNRLVSKWQKKQCSGFWVGFSLEQLVQLQKATLRSPYDASFMVAVPPQRLHYLRKPGRPETSPTHGSYLCLLPSLRGTLGGEQRARFREEARGLGWGFFGQ